MDHYTHTLIGDERAALDLLPTMTPTAPAKESAAMTGTYDAAMTEPCSAYAARTAPGKPPLTITGQDAMLDTAGVNRAESLGNTGVWQPSPAPDNETGPLAQRLEQGTHNHTSENPNDNDVNELSSPSQDEHSTCASAQVSTPANTCPQVDSGLAQVVDA